MNKLIADSNGNIVDVTENSYILDIIDKNKYNSLPPDSFILFQNNGKSKIFSKNEMNNYMKIFDSLKENKEN